MKAQSDLNGATAQYTSSLEILKKLASQDPTNTGWQHDLALIYSRQGDLLKSEDDLSSAKTQYTSSLEVMQKLAQQHPDNSGWQLELSELIASSGVHSLAKET